MNSARTVRLGDANRMNTSSRRRFAIAALIVVALQFGAPLVSSRHAAPAAAQGGLIAYHKVAQWPQRTGASQGLFQTPSDLDVSKDGRVFIADPGIGGVHTLLPGGAFAAPFGVAGGFPAQLGQVGPIAIGPDPASADFPNGAERIYVVDPAIDRVAFYDLSGAYEGQWTGIKGQGIAADGAGAVYVLDRETSQVRAFDAASGAQKWAWGARGTDDGQLTSFTDVSVAPDGAVLAIGDKRGQRVQLFDVAPQADVDGGAEPLKLRRVYDLRGAKYTSQDNTCSGERVNALGGDQVFVGQGDGACLVDAKSVTFAIAASASKGTICRATVTLPALRADTQQYYALAKSDPNPGKCGAKQGAKDLTPVIVSYNDNTLRQVATVFAAASNDDSKSPVLFSPETLSMSDADTIFIADSSSKFRFYSKAGAQVATSARDTQQGSFSGDFEFFRIQAAVAADTLGEVIGYYINGKRTGSTFSAKSGIGRFRTVEKRGQSGIEEIIEPVWTDEIVSQNGFRGISVPSIAFNPVTKEVLVLRVETVPQQRTTDVRIARYAPDGRKLDPSWDVPDDGSANPYADLVAGPDGRVYALDDINDVVRVLEPDGTPVRDIPVAFDARAVAAGPQSPDGEVFVLREPGSIERYADDGRITARLDGRPLDFSDPTTLTDLVVDGDGRVYVADGQTSLITVLEPSPAPDEIPIPDDGQCLFKGKSAVDPAVIDLGATTTVRLELNGRCGTDEDPADIVIIVPYYRQLAQGTDPSATTISDMMRLMARVNFRKHRVGIVSYFNTTNVELPLTGDRAAYMAAVKTITRFDPPNQQVKARLVDAMDAGAKLFTDPTRRRVMVLLRANYCTPDFEMTPGQCTGVPPAEDTAQQIRDAGVTIVAVSGFAAFGLASSDEDALRTTDGAQRRMVRYRIPDALATDVTLTHALPANMTVDAASISGGGRWTAPAIVWTLANAGYEGLQATAGLQPTAGGTWPVSAGTSATLTDGWGHPQTVPFPVPQVEVIGPTATPAPPTATPTATSVPPTATAIAPRRLFLPIAHVGRCKSVDVRLDVVLVLDISASMADPVEPGAARSGASPNGPTKLRAAQDAAAAITAMLRPDDRAAVVAFDAAARRASDWTTDRAATVAAIEALANGHGSRVDLGLDAARTAFDDVPPGTTRALVLLSDGLASGTTADAVRAAADRARAQGETIVAIGVGADADASLLATIAGDAGRFLASPSAAALRPLFDDWFERRVVVCE